MENSRFKFRAWDNTNKCMYSNGYICLKWDGIYQVLNPTNMIKREDFMLMQYTGLKDKNGVEIYEGDIVSLNHRSFGDNFASGIVVYDDVFAKYGLDFIDGEGEFYDTSVPFFVFVQLKKVEVIGNIYENTELLEQK